MSSHFNKLTPAQAERLAILIEECGEVIQAATKILRHGYTSKHPDTGVTNTALLERELGDLQFAVELCERGGDISSCEVQSNAVSKESRLIGSVFLHHNNYLIGD